MLSCFVHFSKQKIIDKPRVIIVGTNLRQSILITLESLKFIEDWFRSLGGVELQILVPHAVLYHASHLPPFKLHGGELKRFTTII